MLNKKHNLKSAKSKDKKRDFKEKAGQETKKKKMFQKAIAINILMSCFS